MDELRKELQRLGCTGERAEIHWRLKDPNTAIVWDPYYDPDCEEGIEVNPEQAAKALSLLRDDAPIGECEDEEGKPSVWDVLLSLAHVGYKKTVSWIQEG